MRCSVLLLAVALVAGGVTRAAAVVHATPLGDGGTLQHPFEWNASISVDLGSPQPLSSVLYGIFFEEVGGAGWRGRAQGR